MIRVDNLASGENRQRKGTNKKNVASRENHCQEGTTEEGITNENKKYNHIHTTRRARKPPSLADYARNNAGSKI